MAQLTSNKSVEPFARLWDLDTDDSDTYKPTVTGTVKIRLEKISDAIILLSNHGGKLEICDFSGCRTGKNTCVQNVIGQTSFRSFHWLKQGREDVYKTTIL